MQYWEIIADKLSVAGWSWGYCSAVTRDGWRWIVDAHRGDGRRYIVHSDDLLSAFLELEAMVLWLPVMLISSAIVIVLDILPAFCAKIRLPVKSGLSRDVVAPRNA